MSYFNGLQNGVGGIIYNEFDTPFTWQCEYCGYPRRISEMISSDPSDPCVFCQKYFYEQGGKELRVTNPNLTGPDSYTMPETQLIGINSKNTPSGRGGNDSIPFMDLDFNIDEKRFEVFQGKVANLNEIMNFVNSRRVTHTIAKETASDQREAA